MNDLAANEVTSRARRRPWPIVGPAFAVAGAALWSWTVAGQLTLAWAHGVNLGERWAIAIVAASVVGVFVHAMRGSLAEKPGSAGVVVWRSLVVLALAALVAACAFVVVAIADEALKLHGRDAAITSALALFGIAAAWIGSRRAPRVRRPTSHAARASGVGLRAAVVAVTALAAIELFFDW